MKTNKTLAKNAASAGAARCKLLILLIASSCVMATGSGCATAPGQVYATPLPVYEEAATACFYDFTDVYVKRIYPVLDSAPGMLDLRRADQACYGEPSCVCYALMLSGPLEDLESWVYRELPTSKAVPFKSTRAGGSRIEFRHQGGFD